MTEGKRPPFKKKKEKRVDSLLLELERRRNGERRRMMTQVGQTHTKPPPHHWRKRRCCTAVAVVLICLLALTILLVVILAFTVLKAKDPTTTVLSTSVEGIAPRITLPAVHIELNITLYIQLLVHNPNHASFTHQQGTSHLFFHGLQVGEAIILPGRIPAEGSETMGTRLTIEADKLATDLSFIGEVISGAVNFESRSIIPGEVSLLGIIRHKVVTNVQCQTTVSVFDLKIRSQSCTRQTEL